MRMFDTGANRDAEEGKLDYEAFLSPLVLKKYAEYMHKHSFLDDGTIRDGDNWQKGMPLSVYMKCMWRHFMNVWLFHRGWFIKEDISDALCGALFNVMGYLHEIETEKMYEINEDLGHGN